MDLAINSGRPARRSSESRRSGSLLVGAALLLVSLLTLALSPQPAQCRSLARARELLRNNEQLDGASNFGAPSPRDRFKRHAGGASLKQAQQALLEGDEQVLKHQLPDLIAQAHQDKAVERALLRMLINASLRSSLGNMVASSQQQQQQATNGWQLDNDNSLTQYNQVDGEFVPVRAARMEQAPSVANYDGMLDLAALTDSIQKLQPLIEQQQQVQQFQPTMDKREYIKPCSFNAISCVRTPFRKL